MSSFLLVTVFILLKLTTCRRACSQKTRCMSIDLFCCADRCPRIARLPKYANCQINRIIGDYRPPFHVCTECLPGFCVDGGTKKCVPCGTSSPTQVPTKNPIVISPRIWINEIHYDNTGTDINEGVEIAGIAGTNLSDYELEFYNGANGALYQTTTLSGILPNHVDGYGTLFFAILDIQNGSPDGMALIDTITSEVLEFISYEGSFTAVDGTAAGLTSVDIDVSEASSTAVGHSLQLTGNGINRDDFVWTGPVPNTYGEPNTNQFFGQSVAPTSVTAAPTNVPTVGPIMLNIANIWINEIHYDNTGTDSSEAIEIAGEADTDLNDYYLILYNGAFGTVYSTLTLSGVVIDSDNDGFGTIYFNATDLQNGSPDGIALIYDGIQTVVLEFISYEGNFTAVDGPAQGLTSNDIGVSEYSNTPVGYSLQLQGIGITRNEFSWTTTAIPNTFGNTNTGQSFA